MRILAFALVLSLVVPAASAAQTGEWSDRFSVTAFTGARAPFTTGNVVVYGEDGEALFAAREQRGGNPVLGLDAQARVWRNVGVLVGGMYSRTGNGEFFIDRAPAYGERGDFAVRYLSHTWFAKAGATVRVAGGSRVKDGRPMPSSDVFAAGAMVRQFEANHPAVNLGFRGSFPVLARGLEATIGIEDYFVFWDEEALAPVMLEVLGDTRTGSAAAEMFYDTSHLLVLRLGATFHF